MTAMEAISQAFALLRDWGQDIEKRLAFLENSKVWDEHSKVWAELASRIGKLEDAHKLLDKQHSDGLQVQDRANPRFKLRDIEFSLSELEELVQSARLIDSLLAGDRASGTWPQSMVRNEAGNRFGRALNAFHAVGRVK